MVSAPTPVHIYDFLVSLIIAFKLTPFALTYTNSCGDVLYGRVEGGHIIAPFLKDNTQWFDKTKLKFWFENVWSIS